MIWQSTPAKNARLTLVDCPLQDQFGEGPLKKQESSWFFTVDLRAISIREVTGGRRNVRTKKCEATNLPYRKSNGKCSWLSRTSLAKTNWMSPWEQKWTQKNTTWSTARWAYMRRSYIVGRVAITVKKTLHEVQRVLEYSKRSLLEDNLNHSHSHNSRLSNANQIQVQYIYTFFTINGWIIRTVCKY